MKKLLLLFGLFLGFGSAAFAAADEGNVEEAMAKYNGSDGATGLTNYCNASMSNEFYEQLLLRLASQIKGEFVESYGAMPQLNFSPFHVEKLEGYLSINKTIFDQTITSDNKRGALSRLLKIAIDRVKGDSSLVPEPKIIPQREEIQRSSLEEVIELYTNTDNIDLLRKKLRYLFKEDMIQFMYQASLSRIMPYNNLMKNSITYSSLWQNEDFLADMIAYTLSRPEGDVDINSSGVAISIFFTMGIIPFVQKKLKEDATFKAYLLEKCDQDIVKGIEDYPEAFEDSEFQKILEEIKKNEEIEEKERLRQEALFLAEMKGIMGEPDDREYALRVANQERYEELLHQGFTTLSTMFRNGEAPITNSNDLIRKMNRIGDQFFRQGPPPPMHHDGDHRFFGGFGQRPPTG